MSVIQAGSRDCTNTFSNVQLNFYIKNEMLQHRVVWMQILLLALLKRSTKIS